MPAVCRSQLQSESRDQENQERVRPHAPGQARSQTWAPWNGRAAIDGFLLIVVRRGGLGHARTIPCVGEVSSPVWNSATPDDHLRAHRGQRIAFRIQRQTTNAYANGNSIQLLTRLGIPEENLIRARGC
jgi:hypothetical protein